MINKLKLNQEFSGYQFVIELKIDLYEILFIFNI